MVYTQDENDTLHGFVTMIAMNGIGTRLKALREELGLTQEQVGASIGVTRAAISQLELGKTHTMDWPHLKAAAKFFRCEVEYLAEGKGPRRVRNPGVRWSETTVDAADSIEEMPEEQRKMVLALIQQLSKR